MVNSSFLSKRKLIFVVLDTTISVQLKRTWCQFQGINVFFIFFFFNRPSGFFGGAISFDNGCNSLGTQIWFPNSTKTHLYYFNGGKRSSRMTHNLTKSQKSFGPSLRLIRSLNNPLDKTQPSTKSQSKHRMGWSSLSSSPWIAWSQLAERSKCSKRSKAKTGNVNFPSKGKDINRRNRFSSTEGL